VDNTSDVNKPVSTAQQSALDLKANSADLATVATSGDYNDLSNTPDLSVYDEVEQYANLAAFPATGDSSKFYLAQDTGIMYRWTGSAYTEISAQLALGETSSTAYRGDRGKTAYDHSQVTTGNPHSVTKSDVGLGNVPNTDATDRANHTGSQTASTISDFDAEVSNNTDVVANTAKVSADGSINTHSDVDTTGQADGKVLTYNSTSGKYEPQTPASGVTDHGALTGLGDDDHTQYHNDTRGDARYHTKTVQDATDATQDAAIALNTAKNSYPTADATKLAGIEDNATADQTGAEIKAAYEGEANTNAFTDAEKTLLGNQSGTNTGDVSLGGTPNYITIVGQVITRALINLTSHVTGILPIANGGTGASTASGAFDAIKQAATTTSAGVVEKSTSAENVAGTATGVTPDVAGVKEMIDEHGGDMSNPMTTQGDTIYGGTSGAPTRLAKGTAGQVLTMNAGATTPEWADAGGGGGEDYVLIQHQETQGTNGGTFTSGSWQTRTMNTEVVDTGSNASISSNQITLVAGTYRFRCWAGAMGVKNHQTRLRNTSDSTTVAQGSTEYSFESSGWYPSTHSEVTGRFTIASSKTFELQHQCNTTRSTYGFGIDANFGTEVYAQCEFWKEA
jgi:hypothetical protein